MAQYTTCLQHTRARATIRAPVKHERWRSDKPYTGRMHDGRHRACATCRHSRSHHARRNLNNPSVHHASRPKFYHHNCARYFSAHPPLKNEKRVRLWKAQYRGLFSRPHYRKVNHARDVSHRGENFPPCIPDSTSACCHQPPLSKQNLAPSNNWTRHAQKGHLRRCGVYPQTPASHLPADQAIQHKPTRITLIQHGRGIS